MGTTTECCHGNWQSKFCCKTLFFNIVTTLTNAFLTMMNKSLHAMLLKICTSGGDPLSPLLKHTTTTSHPLTGLHKHSVSADEHQWVLFFHMKEFNDTPVLLTHFHVRHHSQSAPPLQFLTQQQTGRGPLYKPASCYVELYRGSINLLTASKFHSTF